MVLPLRSMASAASMLLPSPAIRLPLVRNWAAVARRVTRSREMSLPVLPLAVTLSAYLPWVATLMALLKKEGDRRFVPEV